MLSNYFRIAVRNARKNKLYSLLNVVGLATGMSVAIIIGLWVWDEWSFDKYHPTHDRVARVLVNATNNNQTFTGQTVSIPMGLTLRERYGSDFRHIALVSHQRTNILSVGDKKLSREGHCAEASLPSLLGLKMIAGNIDALKDPSSMLLCQSVATALFGKNDPLGKTVRIDNTVDMQVRGVYENLPANTTFREASFLLPWSIMLTQDWVQRAQTQWDNHMCQLYVELNPAVNIALVNEKIRSIPTPHISFSKEELMLQPMDQWRLYSDFRNGKIAGGRISLVWLIGTIGVFVLLLACINFMNLSTARSEKRSREVGIRKTIGSLRGQLIAQFLTESLLMSLLASVIAIIIVLIALPFFNEVADKQMALPFDRYLFWLMVMGFTFFTGLAAGSYPAFYLSGFQPVKVLKGAFKAGAAAALPRKVLVVIQFTVSVALIIGTLVVYRQIQHATNRPVGYGREGLLTITMNTPELRERYDALRTALLSTGVVANVAQSNSSTTQLWSNNVVEWKGKDPGLTASPGTVAVSHDFGATVKWQMVEGRDFSRDHPSDTFAFIINESAAKLIGFKNPIGQTIRWLDQEHEIVGVVKDLVMESPYQPVRPTIFHLNPYWASMITLRVKEQASLREALAKIEPVFQQFNPGSPFVYKINSEEYEKKFSDERRVGNLTTIFAVLAVFISCLGLFGLASFVAEQRTREVGVRKVLGASVYSIWKLLSADFIILVIVSCAIAVPLSIYFLQGWLQQYGYRTRLSWWIFGVSIAGIVLITVLTITYQVLRAAFMNPVKSIKTE